MPETTLKRCAVCQNWSHCTAAGYCNCGAYSVREETTRAPTPDEIADEVELARKHLHVALGSVLLLTGHMSNALEVKEHITRALNALPQKQKAAPA